MKNIVIFLMFTVPFTACADCILTQTAEKFEIICSGYNPLSPVTADSKKIPKIAKRPHTGKKVRYEDGEDITSKVGMNEEELQFMRARNKMDGYRGPKPGVQVARNQL